MRKHNNGLLITCAITLAACIGRSPTQEVPASPTTADGKAPPAAPKPLSAPDKPLVSNGSAPRGLAAKGADLRGVTVITDRVLMLTFVDGRPKWPTFGKGNDGDMEYHLLDVYKARQPGSYRVFSKDDQRYGPWQYPAKVGRKSKGESFLQKQNETLWAMNHSVYLLLPAPLQQGKAYRIDVGDLSSTTRELEFVFDERKSRSEGIQTSQLGYAPKAPAKFAYLSHWMGDLGPLNLDDYAARKFHLIEEKTGEIAFSGTPKLRMRKSEAAETPHESEAKSFAGTDVWELDFSSFGKPGSYFISVEQMGRSHPFVIAEDVYRRAYVTTARGIFHQRSGIEIKKEHSPLFARPACHHPEINGTVYQQTTIRYMDEAHSHGPAPKPEQLTGEIRKGVWGGHQDAGDWDREDGHLNVASHLLTAFELRPQNFGDGELNIPESGNGIPDIVDEARWSVDYYRRIQRPNGGVGVGAFAHSYPKAGETCWTDTHPWYMYAEEPRMSYRYVAAALHLAFVLDRLGRSAEAREYVASAQKAWNWAGKNMRKGDEAKVRDDRHRAAAWMYKVTGDLRYEAEFKKDLMVKSASTPLTEWQKHDQRWAVWAYATTEQPGMDQELRERLRQAVQSYARSENIEPAKKRAYRVAYGWWVPMFWGSASHLRAQPLMLAHALTGEDQYLEYFYTSADFALGTNPLNMTWVTGLGQRYPKQVFNINTWYTETREPVHGLLPFGPHRNEADDSPGPWDHQYAQVKTAYPHAKAWPPYELYFEIRGTPATNEYVVETSAEAAAQFGYLSAPLAR